MKRIMAGIPHVFPARSVLRTAVLTASVAALLLKAGWAWPSESPKASAAATKDRAAPRWTPAAEARIGEVADHFLTQAEGLYTERPALVTYLEKVGRELADRAGSALPAPHFSVLDSADVSAYALPGGYVYISRGLLARMNSEDELAAVLAHEIAHVAARHGLEQIPESEARPLLEAGAALATDPRFIPQLDRTARQVASRALSGYSREQEQEAAKLAAGYLKKARYAPAGALALEDMLSWTEARAPERVEPWRAAHGGSSAEGAARAEARDGKPGRGRKASRKGLRRDPYLDAIDGILMGMANQNGVVAAGRYIGKSRDYSILIPEGWRASLQGADLRLSDPASEATALVTMQTLIRPGVSGQVAREYVRSQAVTEGLESAGAITKATLPAGEGAIARLVSRNADGSTKLVRKVFLVRFDRVYVVSFTTAKDREEATQATFMTLTGSLKFLGANDARDAPEPRLTVRAAVPGDTWASLAAAVGPPALAPADLTAFNGCELAPDPAGQLTPSAPLPAKIKIPPAGSLD